MIDCKSVAILVCFIQIIGTIIISFHQFSIDVVVYLEISGSSFLVQHLRIGQTDKNSTVCVFCGNGGRIVVMVL